MKKRLFSTKATSPFLHIWLLILRLGVSAMMLTHGWPKLLRILDGDMKFGDPYGLGAELSLILTVFAEVVCAVLVMLGLATRLAVIPLLFTMGTAAFVVHVEDPFGKQELPILYMLVYFTLLVTGSGKYSLDRKIGG